MSHSRRLGRFEVSGHCVNDASEELQQVLAYMKFVPLRVEFLFYKDAFDYTGISPLFESVEKGSIIPTYQLHISHNLEDGIFTVSVEQIK
jgi:hypothetical protein